MILWGRQQMMTTADMRDDEDGGRREAGDNIRHIGREIVNGVPLGGTETAAPIAPSPSPAEERPTKNRPAHNIGCGIKRTEKACRLNYRTQDCSSGSRQ